MRTSWLLEKDVFVENGVEKRIVSALLERQADFYWLHDDIHGSKKGFVKGARYVKDPPPNPTRPVVAYGSISWTRHLLAKGGMLSSYFHPIAWMNLSELSCRSYYTHWNGYMLSRDFCFTTWKLLMDQWSSLFLKYGAMTNSGRTIFVKPDQNLKIFSGRVVDVHSFKDWYRMESDCYSIPPEELCVVSSPIPIDKEWRFFVFDRKVSTGSVYKEGGREAYGPAEDVQAEDVARMIAASEWQPDNAYVVDVGRSGGNYGLVEIGSPNCCCLYEGDAGAFVDAASLLAEKEHGDLSPY